MGLTRQAVGSSAAEQGYELLRTDRQQIIALAGNPNVGKSTVFNGLTGLHQHTGNWSGKTVTRAQGYCGTRLIIDLPGTYSLFAHSAEEEVARDFLCFEPADAVVVVCDATALERSLNLVLQIRELTGQLVVCVNLLDEAKRKGIQIDLKALSDALHVPVVGTIARKKRNLQQLLQAVDAVLAAPTVSPHRVRYPKAIEEALTLLEPIALQKCQGKLPARWLALRWLDGDTAFQARIAAHLGCDLAQDTAWQAALEQAQEILQAHAFSLERLRDLITSSLVLAAEEIVNDCVRRTHTDYTDTDRKIDRILTGKWVGYPVMLALLALVFWLTIVGANILSDWLAAPLFWMESALTALFQHLHAPDWLHGVLIEGAFRVLATVVSVMLPPMAIFFPLFTLLEDSGYLPRVAYNLDRPFQKCAACGKQALTMAMGFGCNAAGVVGCRIIDSPRERLLAILTNSFVPCNGRFPTLLTLLTLFFIPTANHPFAALVVALLLTGVIVLSILLTFAGTKLLSLTLLRGTPSAFTLELPPYRLPQVGQVLIRSVFDRTLFVLGRAAAVAAPAGAVLWILSHLTVEGVSMLNYCANFLEPFARWIGLDGAILLAFLLGFPANEIVLPILIMIYTTQGTFTSSLSLEPLHNLLLANGWTTATAVCMVLFCLLHFPCSTTLLTIRKETGSLRWTLFSALFPTLLGLLLCALSAAVFRLCGWL